MSFLTVSHHGLFTSCSFDCVFSTTWLLALRFEDQQPCRIQQVGKLGASRHGFLGHMLAQACQCRFQCQFQLHRQLRFQLHHQLWHQLRHQLRHQCTSHPRPVRLCRSRCKLCSWPSRNAARLSGSCTTKSRWKLHALLVFRTASNLCLCLQNKSIV